MTIQEAIDAARAEHRAAVAVWCYGIALLTFRIAATLVLIAIGRVRRAA